MLSKQEIINELSKALFANAKGAFFNPHLLMIRFTLTITNTKLSLELKLFPQREKSLYLH
jgi:hypothetical protein